jgi:hypothetical protein
MRTIASIPFIKFLVDESIALILMLNLTSGLKFQHNLEKLKDELGI